MRFLATKQRINRRTVRVDSEHRAANLAMLGQPVVCSPTESASASNTSFSDGGRGCCHAQLIVRFVMSFGFDCLHRRKFAQALVRRQ